MDLPHSAQRLLQSSTGEALCDACVAFAIQQPLLAVRKSLEDLASDDSDLRRSAGACASCRRQTTTVYAPSRRDVPEHAGVAQRRCTRCSARLDDDRIAAPNGELYHLHCWYIVIVDKHLRESRAFARNAREALERRRKKLRGE
jgi:hypothetical protein